MSSQKIEVALKDDESFVSKHKNWIIVNIVLAIVIGITVSALIASGFGIPALIVGGVSVALLLAGDGIYLYASTYPGANSSDNSLEDLHKTNSDEESSGFDGDSENTKKREIAPQKDDDTYRILQSEGKELRPRLNHTVESHSESDDDVEDNSNYAYADECKRLRNERKKLRKELMKELWPRLNHTSVITQNHPGSGRDVNVTIKNLAGDTKNIKVNPDEDTVKTLKSKYNPCLPPAKFKLICESQEMQDKDLLSKYGVNGTQTICSVMKL